MKKILLLLCFMSAASASLAQNIDPVPLVLQGTNWDDTTVFTPRRQTKFVLGWQWAFPAKKVSQRLHITTYTEKLGTDDTRDDNFPRLADTGASPAELLWEKLDYLNWSEPNTVWHFTGHSLQFDPTAPTAISHTNPNRIDDTTGAVFGFRNRDTTTHGSLIHDRTHENFDRYMLNKNTPGLPSTPGVTVLSNPVHDDTYWQNRDTFSFRSGQAWFISVNLRRTDTTDIASDSDTILTIKLPFERVNPNLSPPNGPGYITFDSIPVSTLDTLHLINNRGLALKIRAQSDTGEAAQKFVITRAMLPTNAQSGTLPRDITISAYFKFKRPMWNNNPLTIDTAGIQNPYLKGIHTDTNVSKFDVNKINIEVKYHGRSNVAIDWIRIEKPFTQEILRGVYDGWIRQCVEYNLQHIRKLIDSGHNVRLRAFYGHDEPGDDPWEWTIQRYYNQLFDYRFTTEGVDDLTIAAIGYKVPWRATMPQAGHDDQVPPMMPFIKHGDGGLKDTINPPLATHMGFKQGYDGPWFQTDPIGTNYEAEVLGNFEGSVQSLNQESMLYNGSQWWTNVLGYSRWDVGKKANGAPYITNKWNRPQTGEELRLPLWYCLILGGKGIMYDRMQSDVWDSVHLVDPGEVREDYVIGMMRDNDNSTYDTISGDSIIKSNIGGSDFIELNDPSNFHQYINRAQIAANLGVDSNRIYVGRRSMRREVLKLHDKIQIIGDTLMRLRLTAWYGKGYDNVESNDGTRVIQDFLRVGIRPGSLPAPGFTYPKLTRPVGRSTPESWTDSAFVDYTILRDTTVAITDGFYTGVLNRRTNPLVRWPNGSGGDILRFFTTAEFDSICTLTPSWKYKQGGARTITIPFNVNNSTGYALLRVQELGGGIDTVVGQNKDLSVNFLPGEGKIFKVTILKPDNSPQGLLSYSNQRKLVAVPIAGNTDSVRYHMAYHKEITEIVSLFPIMLRTRNAVHYRRSHPTNGKTNEENIKWEPGEEILSKWVTTQNGNDTLNCAYPSIVTRYDSVNGYMKTYVVYACQKIGITTASDSIIIAETQFLSERDRSIISPLGGQKIAAAHGQNIHRWGTPSINASSQGNYYTWSDSTQGIAIGYKPSYFTQFSAPKRYVFWDPMHYRGHTAHPSLNTYSRIDWDENDCALVWQESTPTSSFHIYYTRPYYNSNTNNISFIPLRANTNDPATDPIYTNTGLTIAQLSNGICTKDNEYPVVYRGVETGSRNPVNGRTVNFTSDRVAWEGKNWNYANRYKRIYYRGLDFMDTSITNTPGQGVLHWNSRYHSRITAPEYGLFQPDLSQGSFKAGGGWLTIWPNIHDSAVVLSFTRGALRASTPSSTSTMWHVPLSFWSFYDQTPSTNNTISSVRGRLISPTQGQFAHLAARPILNSSNQYKQTRRIFELGSGTLPYIAQTAQYFYRRGVNSAEEGSVFSGYYWQCTPELLGLMMIDETPIAFATPIPSIDTATLQYTPAVTDTLRTEWFTIGASAELTTYYHGTDTGNVRLELVEQTTMAVVVTPIPMETSTDSTVQEIKHTFINGGGAQYRLQLVKVNSDAVYVEDIMIGELEVDSVGSPRMGAHATSRHKVFDLAAGKQKSKISSEGLHLASYPNPATDMITITCSQDAQSLEEKGRSFYSRNEITLTVSDPMGREIASYILQPGASVSIPTNDLPNGMYMIRAQGSIFGKASSTFVVVH